MEIVYAAPYMPPAPPAPLWFGMRVTWTGWDGSVWDLNDPSGGVCLIRAGVEGLAMPAFTEWVQNSPSVAGQWFRGAVADPRRVFWPLCVFQDASTQGWIDLDRAFWKTMDPEKYGIWTITAPGGSSRSLRCRFKDDDGHAFEQDPFERGWATYGVSLMADAPFWFGPEVSRVWKGEELVDFFPGPPFYISSGSTMANAKINNPGDVDAWPTWTIIGDSTVAAVGVGASVVEVPFVVPAGKALVVNTDPTVQTAVMYNYTPANGSAPELLSNPVDRTADLGTANFAPIPAGQDRRLNISMTGDGIIRAAITPLYRRAW